MHAQNPRQKKSVTLVIGGGRSGKSSFSQRLAERSWPRRLYLATAEVKDREMAERVRRHRRRRGHGWRCVEEPIAVAAVLGRRQPRTDGILLDCVTLWLSNVLLAEGERAFARRRSELIRALRARANNVILVTNEVGMGIVPETSLGRTFRDLAGWLNQALAAEADNVLWVAAGLPIVLKGRMELPGEP